jgi:hypothetical protein
MKMSEEFPGRYLKADNIRHLPAPVVATITGAGSDTMRDGRKILYLLTAEFEQPVKFGKQQGDYLTGAFGSDDTDDWVGRQVHLVIQDQLYNNQQYEVVRMRVPKAAVTPPRKKAAQAQPGQEESEF